MKKLLLAGNIVLFVLLLMAHRSEDQSPPPQTQNVQLGIDPSLSRQMLAEYRDKVWSIRQVNGGSGKDARSVWFSLEKLKAFINNIESQVPAGCNPANALGVRFYYAAYPDSGMIREKGWKPYFNLHGLPDEYRNLHTLIMVPTYYNNTDGHNYDFDPRFKTQDASGQCVFAPVKEVMESLNRPGTEVVPPRGFSFKPATGIPNKQTFMTLPDNLDNRRFIYGSARQSAVSGLGTMAFTTTSLTQSEFTNAGNLIPPPYPKPEDLSARTAAPVTNGAAGPTSPQARIPSDIKIHVPSSGASYMRWVDDTNDTGWVKPPVRRIDMKVPDRTIRALLPQ